MEKTILGDFTGLAEHYARYRAGYSDSVLGALLGLHRGPVENLADVGAGTGIWTRQLALRTGRRVWAVEPNEQMRKYGQEDRADLPIEWRKGQAEATGLESQSCDWVSMASSFHWPHFEEATREFHRILRPGGRLVALWNPRMVELNPLLAEIEAHLRSLSPQMKRVSSGRSTFTDGLTERLWSSQHFTDVVYMEGRHTELQTPERYLGLWRSVNDVRAQLGEEAFQRFLGYVEERIRGLEHIEATYLTRAWSALRRD